MATNLASGSFYDANERVRIDWVQEEINRFTCTSKITCSAYLICEESGTYSSMSGGSIDDLKGYIMIGNESQSTVFNAIPAFNASGGTTKFLGAFSGTVKHNVLTGEFESSITIGISSTTNGRIFFQSPNDAYRSHYATPVYQFFPAGDEDFQLTAIPRTTTISVPTTAYIADDLNISISRAYSEFTHTIEYQFGTLKGVILNKSTASSYTWLVPIALMDEIPDTQNSMTCTLTTTTYYVDDVIGTETNQVVLKINSNLSGPVLEPTVVDINNITVALTGDSSVIVKDCSVADCKTNATLLTTGDIITSSYIRNGEVVKEGTAAGFIAPTSRDFEFYVETRRGLTARKVVQPTFIDYVSPTCRQKITTTISGDENTEATITLLITGNYYNGSFGAQNNSLKIEVQHTQNDGTMGDWVDLTDGLIPVFDGNTYSLEVKITGFRHDMAYDFTTRVTDKLKSATSEKYVARVLPVFDWSGEDFNFNVPINLNGQTILRHNETANNTVLSATGGYIYFRQGGTNSTSTEVKITPQGNIELEGDIIINGQSLKSLLGIT